MFSFSLSIMFTFVYICDLVSFDWLLQKLIYLNLKPQLSIFEVTLSEMSVLCDLATPVVADCNSKCVLIRELTEVWAPKQTPDI